MKKTFFHMIPVMLSVLMLLSVLAPCLAAEESRIVPVTEPRLVVETEGLSPEDAERKLANSELIQKLFFDMFWAEEFAEDFDPEFTIDLPFAPPGVPQHMDPFNTQVYMAWLRRSVHTWEIDPTNHELYGTPDPDLFFLISYVKGDVTWGGNDGVFSSKRIDMIRLQDGKVCYVREWTNPLEWLYAAGREVPIFHVDLEDERVAEMHEIMFPSDAEPMEPEELDMSEEAIAARFAQNIAFMNGEEGAEEIDGANYINRVLFMPPEMYEPETYEADEWMASWSVASILGGEESDLIDDLGMPLGYGGCSVYETDDPLIYFNESSYVDVCDWIGNGTGPSYYRNWYIHVYRFNPDGTIQQGEEHLNPINKFNCINVSIPSFPYFY